MRTIKLFREIQSCQECLFSWEGYSHGFSRGHTVFEKGSLVVFAPDDLGYLVPVGEHIEIESQLKSMGWHQMETCPKCGSRKLFPLEYSEESALEVECIEINRDDLVKGKNVWELSNSALSKLA